MRLNEIMSKGVVTVSPNTSADAAWEQLWRDRFHHLVVMDGKRVVGVLSDRDLGGPRGQRLRSGRSVSDLMSASIVAAGPKTTLRQAANLMRGRSIGCLPILEGGRLKGIVTVSDLLEQIGRGAERPIAKGKRWTLSDRGPRHTQERRAAK
jgi:acetoin utilization protein AcuB